MSADIFLAVGALLLVAKAFGGIAEKLGVASMVGEIAAGILLGPVLGLSLGAAMPIVLMFGIVFLLFVGGLGVKYADIKDNFYSASFSAVFCALLSFGFGLALGFFVLGSLPVGVALGAILAMTNDGVVFSLLMRIGAYQSKLGKALISTDIADDVIGIILLSVFTLYATSSVIAIWGLWSLAFAAIGFYFFLMVAGPRIMNGVLDVASRVKDDQILFAVPIGVMFLIAAVAENIALGLASGAFLAGMSLASSKHLESEIAPKVRVMANGFFIPLFFGAVGMLMTFAGLDWMLVLLILAVAVAGKLIAGFLSAAFMGFRGGDSLLFGLLMVPRGDTNIVVAQIALALGVISGQVFTAVIAAIILTIIIVPVVVRVKQRSASAYS